MYPATIEASGNIFDVLGMRYRFDHVTLYLDSALVGPDESTALAQFKKVPPGMYLNAVAFFVVYHTMAIICMRRVRTMTTDWSLPLRRAAWVVTGRLAGLQIAMDGFFHSSPPGFMDWR